MTHSQKTYAVENLDYFEKQYLIIGWGIVAVLIMFAIFSIIFIIFLLKNLMGMG